MNCCEEFNSTISCEKGSMETVSSCACGPGVVCGICKPAPNLGKPGKRTKKQPKYSKIKIHNIERPKERVCVNCGTYTATERYRHAEDSTIKFLDGGGIIGDKIDGFLTGYLCDHPECGVKYDTKPNREAPEIERLRHDLFTAVSIIKTWLLKDKK